MLFLVTIMKGKIKKVEMIPVEISMCQVNIARGDVYKEISERITRLSEEFGTKVEKIDDRPVINVEHQVKRT